MAGSPVYFLDELTRWQDAETPGQWDLALRERIFSGLPDLGAETMRRNTALSILALAELEAREGKKAATGRYSAFTGESFPAG